jgi:hypothetical protein
MNIYFLVEGRRTEKKVYPKWLSLLVPKLSEVKHPHHVVENNYYMFNGNGFPSLLDNHLRNAIDDVNSINHFGYFVICLDSDEETVEQRKQQVIDFITENNITLVNCELVIIVQNKCIETWFLGYQKIYSRQPHSEILREFNAFYNVSMDDPELMGKIERHETCAQFHAAYLSEMLAEKSVRYTKKNPNIVTEQYYLEGLIERNATTSHISTFKDFLDFCTKLNSE